MADALTNLLTCPSIVHRREIMTALKIICTHELRFQRKVKLQFSHNETLNDVIIFTFWLSQSIFFFSKSDQICHIIFAITSLWQFKHHTDSTSD